LNRCFKADDQSPARRPFPRQGVDIFAAGNLRGRRHKLIVQFALAHDGARLTECLSEISAAQRRIKECVAETPIDLPSSS
jgi:hypothetical protein